MSSRRSSSSRLVVRTCLAAVTVSLLSAGTTTAVTLTARADRQASAASVGVPGPRPGVVPAPGG